MEFIEAPAFTARVGNYLDENEYAALQHFLAGAPEAGDVVQGTDGFRKVRWRDRRRGKGARSGLRVICYYLSSDSQIGLMTLCDKGEVADSTPIEKRMLKGSARG